MHHKHSALSQDRATNKHQMAKLFIKAVCMLRCSDVINCCRAERKKEKKIFFCGTDYLCTKNCFLNDAFLSGCPPSGVGCCGVDVSWPCIL